MLISNGRIHVKRGAKIGELPPFVQNPEGSPNPCCWKYTDVKRACKGRTEVMGIKWGLLCTETYVLRTYIDTTYLKEIY